MEKENTHRTKRPLNFHHKIDVCVCEREREREKKRERERKSVHSEVIISVAFMLFRDQNAFLNAHFTFYD